MICIYAIKNNINGKVYVGSTNNMTKRFKKHKSELKRNCHCNSHLQDSYNKYGEASLDFIILETCRENQLIKKEKEYVDKYFSLDEKFGYNLILPREPSTRKLSDSFRSIISEQKKGITPTNFSQMRKKRWRKVGVYENNILVNTYESVRVAEELLGIKRCNIHNYLKGKTSGIKHFKHLTFKYED